MENEIRARVINLVSELASGGGFVPLDLRDADAEVVTVLLEALRDDTASARLGALRFLTQAGTSLAKEAVSEVIVATSDDSSEVRSAAFWLLQEIGPEPRVIAALVEKLQSTNRDRRWLAADVLGSRYFDLGWTEPLAQEAIPVLVEMLNDDDRSFVRSPAANVLANLGPLGKDAAPALLRVFNDRHPGSYGVRCRAVIALGKIGPENGVVRSLIRALNDSDPEISLIRKYAAEALARIGPEKSVTRALLKALKTRDGVPEFPGGYSTYAGVALANMGPKPEILAGLVKCLRNRNKCVRRGAAASLGLLRSGARGAVNPLVGAMETKDDDVVLACIIALDRITSKDISLVPTLSRSPFWERRLDPLAAPYLTATVPSIAKLLNRNQYIASGAANILGEIGSPAFGVEQMLTGLIRTANTNDEWNLKTNAARALARVSSNEKVIANAIQSLRESFADDLDYLASGLDGNSPNRKDIQIRRILNT